MSYSVVIYSFLTVIIVLNPSQKLDWFEEDSSRNAERAKALFIAEVAFLRL